MLDAIDRRRNNARGNDNADKFLNSMEITSQGMPHGKGAADQARNRMFSMFAYFGLPAMMFTVTIEDGYNFRARIYSGRYCDPQSQFPDFRLDDEGLITEFSLDCSCPFQPNIRLD